MKQFFKKTIYLSAIFIIIGLIFLGYAYTARNLKALVISELEKSFGTKLSIAHMRMSFPLCLQLKGVKINDTINIAKVYIYPSPASAFLKKTFIFSSIKILEPVIKMKKGHYESFTAFRRLKNDTVRPALKDSKAVFFVSRIDVENATVVYEEEDGIGIELVKIDANLKSPYAYLIAGRLLNFNVSGFVKNKNSKILSPLRVQGWVKGDYTVKARLRIQDVGIEALGPVYQKYIKQKVEKGNLNLDSKILVSKNDLKADCFCRINDIILKDAVSKLSMPLMASFILGFDFKDRAVKIDNLKTNLFSLLFNKS
ncbi:MAG: DUF748 domain-containing protein [Candidatus Omnitrophota bacterium]|nr:DUF748 domain-containing protein [Candidatus Omnitrophota bacterium]